MKIRNIACTSMALVWACSLPLMGNDVEVFSKVPAPETAAKAAELVSKASKEEQDKRLREIVTAAVQSRPTLAPSVVGAIAKSTPEQAAAAASVAAKLEPKQVGLIVKAACAAAPDQVGAIVFAVCKELPKNARTIAIAAAQAVPGKDKEILAAVGNALPLLKGEIERALAQVQDKSFTVASVFARAETVQTPIQSGSPTVTGGSAVPAAPIVGPPFTPGSGTPGEKKTDDTGQVNPGGPRNYSEP